MVKHLGSNQRLVLHALAALDKELGPGPYPVRVVIDRIWQEQCAVHVDFDDPDARASLLTRAADGDRKAVQALRISEALHRRVAARLRSDKRPSSKRVWAKAVDTINPTQCFRDLARRQLIERTLQPGLSLVRLTDAGRELASNLVMRA